MARGTAIEIRQGRTWTLQVGWYNPKPLVSPIQPDMTRPIDITGYSAKLWIVPDDDHTDTPALVLTSPSGGLVVTGPAGTVDIRATSVQTLTLAEGFWWWELEITNGTDTYTLADGPVAVVAEVVV